MRVLIGGSGVAAVEAVLALRHLAGRGFDIELLAPAHALEHRPASVATPFGFGAPPPLDLHELARRYDVALVAGELAGVDVDAKRVRLASGGERGYDQLLVATGAKPECALPGSLVFRGTADVAAMESVLDDVRRGRSRQIVVVVPPGASWPLPAYELAIMAATELRGVREATVTLATPEPEPLQIFGDAAHAVARDLLGQRGIGLRTGARAARVTDGMLWFEDGRAMAADSVVSLPVPAGPRIPGLPSDDAGFLPTDAHGRVAPGVLAAGDATDFAIKQGGLATQQADAAAATIAHELGADVEPRPFTPVLRGLLLTGGAPLYLRAEGGTGHASWHALWSPPGKVAGRYLAPYLSTARPVALGEQPLIDRVR